MEHYQELINEIERRYPEHDPEWWHKTAVPAFAFCWTIIWGHAPEPAECPACHANISGWVEERCPRCAATLSTRPCPECHGRGVLRDWWWKWIAGASLVLSGILLALSRSVAGPNASGSHEGNRWVIVLLVVAALTGLFALRDWRRPYPCLFCEKTGWWDPRGRAARRIPTLR